MRCSSQHYGRCETVVACDVNYSISVIRGKMGDWHGCVIGAETLLEPLSESDFNLVDAKLSRYAALGKSWQRFLARRRAGDVLWRYWEVRIGPMIGIANLRDGRSIATFNTFVDL